MSHGFPQPCTSIKKHTAPAGSSCGQLRPQVSPSAAGRQSPEQPALPAAQRPPQPPTQPPSLCPSKAIRSFGRSFAHKRSVTLHVQSGSGLLFQDLQHAYPDARDQGLTRKSGSFSSQRSKLNALTPSRLLKSTLHAYAHRRWCRGRRTR